MLPTPKVALIRSNNSLSLILRPISKKTVIEKPEDRESSFIITTPKLPSASVIPSDCSQTDLI